MRILITGSRNWTDYSVITGAIAAHIEWPARLTTIVHGGAEGADKLADKAARYRNCGIEVHRPDYKSATTEQERKLAPLRRNDKMLDSGIDLVLAFMLGTPEKGGTLYTVNGARARRIPVVIYNWPGDDGYKP